MTQHLSNATLPLVALLASGLAGPALALDAACERVASAAEKKLAASAFHDRKDLGSMVHEMLLANGKLYQRDTFGAKAPGAWQASPITVAMIRSAAATYRSQLQACKSAGSDTVEGVATEVVAFTVKAEGMVVDGKVWIGKADGLPYREESKGMKGTTVYRDVKAPL